MTKAADIVGLYFDPPDNAIAISVDEKIVRPLRSTYKRNGALNLFAALETDSGSISANTTGRKTRGDFLAFMDDEIHAILDNYCTHKRCDDWLRKHPGGTLPLHVHVGELDESGGDMVLHPLRCNAEGCKLRESGCTRIHSQELRGKIQ